MASNMPHKYTVQYDHSNYETTTNVIIIKMNTKWNKKLKTVLTLVKDEQCMYHTENNFRL